MSRFIDRRQNGKNKSTVNRQRFLRRYKTHIKKAVEQSISKRNITDIEKGEKISISKKDLSEPSFKLGTGGTRELVFPGNHEFIKGDRIKKQSQSQGQGADSKASNTGEGEDAFDFNLTKDEFFNIYFEDLALPDLIKKQMTHIPASKLVRAGIVRHGVPTNLNVVKSLVQSTARRVALTGSYKERLHEIEKRLVDIEKSNEHALEKKTLLDELAYIKRRIQSIPYLDELDLRFNHRIHVPSPFTQAVMFCIMDVSGSMDEIKKDIAKRFFILLYLFLTRTYEKIELVFIRHHTSAKEVSEEEFFYSRETGGTVVSSALELMTDIIAKRYPINVWNIYAAQASDGDNWNADSPYCKKVLIEKIMPTVQYFAYTEIMPRHHQSLWEAYTLVQEKFKNFAIQTINQVSDIYPVFRELFKRQN